MTTTTPETDALRSFSDAELIRMRDRAWLEAAQGWQDYHRASADVTMSGRRAARLHKRRDDVEEQLRLVRQAAHDAAWAAEHHWRHLYDACRARGI